MSSVFGGFCSLLFVLSVLKTFGCNWLFGVCCSFSNRRWMKTLILLDMDQLGIDSVRFVLTLLDLDVPLRFGMEISREKCREIFVGFSPECLTINVLELFPKFIEGFC